MPNDNEKPIIGKEYGYYEIENFYSHDPTILRWVIIKGINIVALRLREDYNREILGTRPEVWVGADSPTCIWGDRIKDILERKNKTLPVFVRRNCRAEYEYLGRFEYDNEIVAPHPRCKAAEKRVPHKRGISRIVFLKKN